MPENTVKFKVDSNKTDPFIRKKIMQAVGEILNHCKKNYNAEYSDQSVLMLYNKTEQFVKEVQDLVSAENMNPDVDIFGTPVNYNYFNQQRQF